MRKIILLIILMTVFSCKDKKKTKNEKLQVVTTTTMITDLVKNIGGDKIEVQGLMGAGIDPHLYKASEGDVSKLFNANVVIYNGLHLEGKLEDVFEKMRKQGKNIIAVADAVDQKTLIGSESFASNFDPHIWLDVDNWERATLLVVTKLSDLDAKNASIYQANGKTYLKKLAELKKTLNAKVNELPEEQRILVTAHDAFNYFGRQHKFNVVGLQGLSTATEAGVQDVQKLTKFIIDNKVKAVFIESSVPRRTIEALQQAVKSKGHEVKIGGTLYSDALGNPETDEGTYIGMYKANVNTIVDALK